MKSRYRTIALQAVGVAVLAAAIFVAFLRPSDPSDLSGIEARGGQPHAVNPPPTHPGGGAHHRHQNGSASDGGGRSGANGGGNAERRGAGGGSGGSGASIGGSDSLGSPTGNQYGDLVTQLLAKVESPDTTASFVRVP